MLIPGDKPDLRSYRPASGALEPIRDTDGPSILPAIRSLGGFVTAACAIYILLIPWFAFSAFLLGQRGFFTPESTAVIDGEMVWLLSMLVAPFVLFGALFRRDPRAVTLCVLTATALVAAVLARIDASIPDPLFFLVTLIPVGAAVWMLDKHYWTPAVPVVAVLRRGLLSVSLGSIGWIIYGILDWFIELLSTDPLSGMMAMFILPVGVVLSSMISVGPYLAAVRLIPADRRNAVVWIAIGVAINSLLFLITRSPWLLTFTVLVPAGIAIALRRWQPAR